LAGFQVTLIGRFWVTAEALVPVDPILPAHALERAAKSGEDASRVMWFARIERHRSLSSVGDRMR
jgi:hypothetical protein